MTITASVDGSALGNPGPAGWAWYIDESSWAAGGWKHATNNQGELTAVLELLRATSGTSEALHIFCDSQYVINSVTKWMPGWKAKGWRKGDGKPVLNLELLKELDEALNGRSYTFEWVKGHRGHELNEAADVRARAAAEAYARGGVVPSGPGFAGQVRNDRGAGTAEPEAAAPTGQAVHQAPSIQAPTWAETDTLFTFDEPVFHEITLSLDEAEFERLHERARQAGVAVEELLRSLI